MARRSGGRAKAPSPRPPGQPAPPRPPELPRAPGRRPSLWGVFCVLCAVLGVLAWVRMGPGGGRLAYRGDFAYDAGAMDASVVVTPPFELTGRTSSVEVAVSTDLDNSWVRFDYALIEQRTGRAILFGREVAFYHGTSTEWGEDGRRYDETYVEGSRLDAVRVPSVPPGRYVLRIAPGGPTSVLYSVRVRRDVPGLELYAVAFLLLLVPPVFASLGGGKALAGLARTRAALAARNDSKRTRGRPRR